MGSAKQSRSTPFELAHPVYLDTPMLVSFLAALEDGVSYHSEIAEKQAQSKKSTGEASGAVKLPSLASLLGLNLSVNGKYSRESGGDQSTESKFIREHTSASLFNRLRSRLHADGLVREIPEGGSIVDVVSGDIVEVAGQFEATPLRLLIDFMKNVYPFAEEDAKKALAALPEVKRNQRRSGSQQGRADELHQVDAAREEILKRIEEQEGIMRTIEILERDLLSSPMVDLIFRQSGFSGLVTANREYFTSEVAAALVGGRFSMIGKVTAVDVRENASNSVVRRGGMGAFANSIVVPMLKQMREDMPIHGVEIELPEAHIGGHYIQVIPLAIFV
ncbi:hypothetical protein [Amycolatopsis sp. cg9]|uniref:DUF6414 family protein n=1 Tax=Amycolatopsis sp. cg9 TaxID=3238801 RepID=UPI0035247A20